MTTQEILKLAKEAKTSMMLADTDKKNAALLAMAEELIAGTEEILAEGMDLSSYAQIPDNAIQEFWSWSEGRARVGYDEETESEEEENSIVHKSHQQGG